MPLPTKKTPPITTLAAYKTLIYGPPGAGKTTLAAGYPDALFLATEPGCQALEAYVQPIGSWDDFLKASEEIQAGRHAFKTVIIDTIDILWKYCHEWMLCKLGQEVEKDDFGRTSTRIKNEFHRELARLAGLPYGLVLVSHSTEREIEARTGKYAVVTPSLAKAPREIVLAMMDLVLYLEVVPEVVNGRPTGNTTRQIRTRQNGCYDAKCRIAGVPDPLGCTYTAVSEAMRAALGNTPVSSPAPLAAPAVAPTPPAKPSTPVTRRRGQPAATPITQAPEPAQETPPNTDNTITETERHNNETKE